MFWRKWHSLPRLARRLDTEAGRIEEFLPYLPREYGVGAFDPDLPVGPEGLVHPLSELIEYRELRYKIQSYGAIRIALLVSLRILTRHAAREREQWARIGSLRDSLRAALPAAPPRELPILLRHTASRIEALCERVG